MRHFDERIGVTMRILGMLLGAVLLAGCSTST
ncbi:TPA: 3-isopropylmalate dehydratase large subunit, partial [Pseudomonas aeruginosa]|nr:3-isopropylmalate dehydratase large subunit [Pseudomonas aeruginosa]